MLCTDSNALEHSAMHMIEAMQHADGNVSAFKARAGT